MSELRTLQSRGNGADRALGDQLRRLSPWFHNLHLPDGTHTAPDHPLGDFPAFKWALIAPHLPSDLSGWRVLDIGCNAGFYSFELARRGAEVLAVDHDLHYLRQLCWARKFYTFGNRVRCRRLDVYQLTDLPENFDLVLFLGVLYHLRHPLLGLDIAASKARRLLVMQTLSLPSAGPVPDTGGKSMEELEQLTAPGWPRMAFVEHELAGDPTNWWVPDPAACEAMLRSSGLKVLVNPERGTYVCAPRTHSPVASGSTKRAARAARGASA